MATTSKAASAPVVLTKMLAKLEESGLTQADAKKLHLEPMNEVQSMALGLSRPGAGFKIPYYTIDGKLLPMFRYRYFEATGAFGTKVNKYSQPADTDPEVYFPQLVNWVDIAADASKPLIITEGELKATCATKHKFTTLGLGGVFSFQRKARHQKMIPALDQFKWRGRDVYICYDSDAIKNRMVLLAEQRLARLLTDLGAIVYIVRLPDGAKGDKMGIDDYIVALGPKAFEVLIAETPLWGPVEELHKINTEVVYVNHPSMVAEFPRENHPKDQSRYRMMRVTTFANEVYATRKYWVEDANGAKKPHKAAPDWVAWDARSAVDSISYTPGGEVIINGNQLNLWEGWGATPVHGDVSPFTELIDYVFKDAPEAHKRWFMQWLAYPLQHPGAKLNTAVVMWSLTQGSGKSFIGYTMGRIYGHNFSEVTKAQLSGSFNGWAANKQFIMGDEITGGSSRDVADLLKSMITGRELTINQKYQPAYTIQNCINYYFTSNHQDAFFLNQEDRRHFIHEIKGEKLPDTFWKRYEKWEQSDEGVNALFDYLLHVDLTGFNPQAEAPHTESRQAMIEAGMSEHAAWCHELHTHPDNKLRVGDVVIEHALYTVEDLMNIYNPDQMRRRSITPKALAIALKEAGFRKVNNDNAVDTGKGKKQNVWAIRNPEDYQLGGAEASKRYREERENRVAKKFTKR